LISKQNKNYLFVALERFWITWWTFEQEDTSRRSCYLH